MALRQAGKVTLPSWLTGGVIRSGQVRPSELAATVHSVPPSAEAVLPDPTERAAADARRRRLRPRQSSAVRRAAPASATAIHLTASTGHLAFCTAAAAAAAADLFRSDLLSSLHSGGGRHHSGGGRHHSGGGRLHNCGGRLHSGDGRPQRALLCRHSFVLPPDSLPCRPAPYNTAIYVFVRSVSVCGEMCGPGSGSIGVGWRHGRMGRGEGLERRQWPLLGSVGGVGRVEWVGAPRRGDPARSGRNKRHHTSCRRRGTPGDLVQRRHGDPAPPVLPVGEH